MQTPGERLKEFFDSTTLSVREFAAEIGNPEGYRTLYNVFKGERDPSSKLVKMIIRRFPQLSYDWIFIGAGDMLAESSDMMRSVHSHEYSVQARYEQTMQSIDKIEYSINELANRIDRSMAHQAEMTNVFFKKIDDMTKSNQYLLESEHNVKEVMKAMTDQMKSNKINEDRIAKSYWESVAFAEKAYELMKLINKKLSEPGSSQSQD